MSKSRYFPLDINFVDQDDVSLLWYTHGVGGIGAYMFLLTELHKRAHCMSRVACIPVMARRYHLDEELLRKTIYDFGLFEFSEVENEQMFSSVYLKKALAAYEEKVRKCSAVEKTSAKNSAKKAVRKNVKMGAAKELVVSDIEPELNKRSTIHNNTIQDNTIHNNTRQYKTKEKTSASSAEVTPETVEKISRRSSSDFSFFQAVNGKSRLKIQPCHSMGTSRGSPPFFEGVKSGTFGP